MNQNEAPVGTIARIGHWNNESRVVKSDGGIWLHLYTGRSVDPEHFRAGWDIEHHDWVFLEDEVPPEGRVVETRSPGGMRQTLKRQENLWFVPDGSMYVYYTPIAWKDVT